MPSDVELASGFKRLYPDGIPGYKGCMSSLVKNKIVVDLRNERLQTAEIRAAETVVSGCVLIECPKCSHGCICSLAQSYCDNSLVPYSGKTCQDPEDGFKFFVGGIPGQVTRSYDITKNTQIDKISFAFISCKPDGLFTKLSGTRETEQIKLFLEGGNIVAEYKLGGDNIHRIELTGEYNDENQYIVQFQRHGLQADLSVLNYTTGSVIQVQRVTSSGSNSILDGLRLVEIGSENIDGHLKNGFTGVIKGYKFGGENIFKMATKLPQHLSTRIQTPGTIAIAGDDDYECPGTPECGPEKQVCKHKGVCYNNVCNCTLTAYSGIHCDDWPWGHYYGFDDWKPGIDIYRYPTPVTTLYDYLAVGVMTYEPNGTILKIENVDGSQFYHLKLVNGQAQFEYRLGDSTKRITETGFTLHSKESIYHVIRMNRTRENITFSVDNATIETQIPSLRNVPFENQYVIRSGGESYSQDNRLISGDWNGILGGLYYNGGNYYGLLTNRSTPYDHMWHGDIGIAPPYKLKIEPLPQCPKCLNDGVRTENNTCDCTYTSYMNSGCCESQERLRGFFTKKYGGNSVVIYNVTAEGKGRDDLSVSFRTARGWENGQIVRIESLDKSQYVIVEIVNDGLRVRHNIGGAESIENFAGIVRDHSDHRVRIHRVGNVGSIQLDGITRNVAFPNAAIFNANVIYAGGSHNGTAVTSGHYGIIWKLIFNGIDVVEDTYRDDAHLNGILLQTDGGYENFEIVNHPWPELCDKGSTSPKCGFTPRPPGGHGGAGGIITVGEPPIVIPPAPVTDPKIPPTTAAIIAAVMGGLLFTSAIAFAAAGMKPGFLALSKRFVGGTGVKGDYMPVGKTSGFPVANGGGKYAVAIGLDDVGGGAGGSQAGTRSQYEDSYTQESRFDATDASMAGGAGAVNGGGAGYNAYNTSSSWYTRNETLENQNQAAYGAGSTLGAYGSGRGGGYAGSVAGGSVAGSVYGFGTVTNPDQAFITLSEDIAVENVVLTADGRYVVTGSNLGPPQVWNTTVRMLTIIIPPQ